MRQNPFATKELKLHPVKEFGPRNKIYFLPVRFRDHSQKVPKCWQEPLQTLIDGNLGNISTGVQFRSMQMLVKGILNSKIIHQDKTKGNRTARVV